MVSLPKTRALFIMLSILSAVSFNTNQSLFPAHVQSGSNEIDSDPEMDMNAEPVLCESTLADAPYNETINDAVGLSLPSLPTDVLQKIGRNLTIKEKANFSSTSRQIYRDLLHDPKSKTVILNSPGDLQTVINLIQKPLYQTILAKNKKNNQKWNKKFAFDDSDISLNQRRYRKPRLNVTSMDKIFSCDDTLLYKWFNKYPFLRVTELIIGPNSDITKGALSFLLRYGFPNLKSLTIENDFKDRSYRAVKLIGIGSVYYFEDLYYIEITGENIVDNRVFWVTIAILLAPNRPSYFFSSNSNYPGQDLVIKDHQNLKSLTINDSRVTGNLSVDSCPNLKNIFIRNSQFGRRFYLNNANLCIHKCSALEEVNIKKTAGFIGEASCSLSISIDNPWREHGVLKKVLNNDKLVTLYRLWDNKPYSYGNNKRLPYDGNCLYGTIEKQ